MGRLFSPSRRGFLSATVSSGLLAMAGPLSAANIYPVVETTHGRLRGVMAGSVAKFVGVRYGAPTGGANRFMPVTKPLCRERPAIAVPKDLGRYRRVARFHS